MTQKSEFDREYFEDGIVAGKSGYVNYHWMPELTIKMAHNIIKYLGIKEGQSVLDYGCAKGFLVKAFRILDIDAFGCDISEYAIEMLEPEVRHYCELVKSDRLIPFDRKFDWFITKDVLEHISEDKLDDLLSASAKVASKAFHVVPLGENDKFIVPEYEADVTHIIRKNKDWWIEKFSQHGWVLESFSYSVKGIKDNWTSKYAHVNGFFVLKKHE
jgi:cyclopropane fatty-acyl-phospholipid synthase-like methyltransferase